jgi:hypothetical protein
MCILKKNGTSVIEFEKKNEKKYPKNIPEKFYKKYFSICPQKKNAEIAEIIYS